MKNKQWPSRRSLFNIIFPLILFGCINCPKVLGQNELRWVKWTGVVPANIVAGGAESYGSPLYICRTTIEGTIVAGKVVNGKCNVNWKLIEHAGTVFDVLTGTGGYWTRQVDPRTAVRGGFYVCRASAHGGKHPGRIQASPSGENQCLYGFGGKGYSTTSFEVLNGVVASGPALPAASLLDLAVRGDARSVLGALRAGEPIDQKNAKGQTALMLAAQRGAVDIVRVLLNQGATVDARDAEGFTALSHAAWTGDAQSIRLLLQAGASMTNRANRGATPVGQAAASGSIEKLRAFITAPGFPGLNDPSIGLLLHMAAAHDRGSMIDHLLTYEEVDINRRNSAGRTAIMVAASENKASAASALLRGGAAVEPDLFAYAASFDATNVMGVLLQSKKFSVQDPSAESAFRVAALDSRKLTFDFMLANGVDVNASDPSTGDNALMLAAAKGHDDVVKSLLNAKAELNAKNARGETALILAASAGRRNVVKQLLKAGADRSIADNNGKTAVDHAAANKHNDTRKDLEKAGN